MAGKKAFRNWLLRKAVASMLKEFLTLKWLKGRRTKVVALIMAVLTFLKLGEIITVEQYTSVVGFLTAIGVLTAADHDK